MPAPSISVIVPLYNKAAFVRRALDALVAAAQAAGDVEVVVVDHSSTDGSGIIAEEYHGAALVHRHAGGNAAAVRNVGARLARGEVLSFVDADCVVPVDYFVALREVLSASGAAATGCEVGIPPAPHWSERVWYELHVVREDGDRRYLNSGNFALWRWAFERVGGFDERLDAGEDTDICARLRAAGLRIFEAQRLRAVHLDNPKSLRAFYRQQRFHGGSVLRAGGALALNRVTLMVAAHAAATAAALLVAAIPSPLALGARLLALVALPMAVPAASVGYRFLETHRLTSPAGALLLYAVFYQARAAALLGSAARALRPARSARATAGAGTPVSASPHQLR